MGLWSTGGWGYGVLKDGIMEYWRMGLWSTEGMGISFEVLLGKMHAELICSGYTPNH